MGSSFKPASSETRLAYQSGQNRRASRQINRIEQPKISPSISIVEKYTTETRTVLAGFTSSLIKANARTITPVEGLGAAAVDLINEREINNWVYGSHKSSYNRPASRRHFVDHMRSVLVDYLMLDMGNKTSLQSRRARKSITHQVAFNEDVEGMTLDLPSRQDNDMDDIWLDDYFESYVQPSCDSRYDVGPELITSNEDRCYFLDLADDSRIQKRIRILEFMSKEFRLRIKDDEYIKAPDLPIVMLKGGPFVELIRTDGCLPDEQPNSLSFDRPSVVRLSS